MIKDKCTTCKKFMSCVTSILEYDLAKKHFPGDSPDAACNRSEWMAEKFQDCKEFEAIR